LTKDSDALVLPTAQVIDFEAARSRLQARRAALEPVARLCFSWGSAALSAFFAWAIRDCLADLFYRR
jgi:hypothetical protein